MTVAAAAAAPPFLAGNALGARRPVDALDWGLFLPGVLLCCALGISLRLVGPLFVAMPVGTCLLYALLRRTLPPRLLTAYVALCLAFGVLSACRLLPASWQVHFMHEAIVRQLVPLIGFFTVAWASKAYFRRRLAVGNVLFGAPLILVSSFAVAPLVMFHQDVGYQNDRSLLAVLSLSGAFINNVTIATFFLLGGVFLAREWRRATSIAVVFAIAVTTHFTQFKLMSAMVLLTLLGARARNAVIGLIAAILIVYGIGMNFIPDLMRKSPNDGLRLALIADVFTSTVDTRGIGIGYGKESVRWRYRFPDMPDFTFLPDARSMTRERMLEALSTGVENSFVQALLRTGITGFVLLVAAVFAAFPPASLPRGLRNHAACLFAMMFLGMFVNSALETPLTCVGLGFTYGYLLALRSAARSHAQLVRSRPVPLPKPCLAASGSTR